MKITVIVSLIVLMCLLSGCSDSDSDNGTAPATAPDTPAGLSVTDTGLASLTLSWDASDDATEYNLYRSESASGIFHLRYPGAATEYADYSLTCGTTYYYQVSAENSTGESDRSAAVNGTTGIPSGYTVTGSPSGSVDYTFNYLNEVNGKPHYVSDPAGLNIMVSSSGDQAGMWVFYDQIEGINLYYNTTDSDYPPPSGYLAVYGDSRTSIHLTPF